MATRIDELEEIIDSLPIDKKTRLVEKILKSLHGTQKEVDQLWAIEAEKRVEEIKSGKVKTIPAEKVFKDIQKKYNK